MIRAKIEGRFTKAIKARREKWGQPIGTILRVGPPAYFWAVHEYGAPPHRIPASKATLIAFEGDTGLVQLPYVDHPGNKKLMLVESVEEEIRDYAKAKVHQAIIEGALDNPERIKASLLESTENAKTLIVQSIAEKMPLRERPLGDPQYAATQSGKLHGQAAADVFRDNATVEDH
jgi:hypothetical protein